MSTNSITISDPAEAIDRSISHDESVNYDGSLADLLDYACEHGYKTDWVDVSEDGYIDVWGWTDETPDDTQDWSINVITGDVERAS